MGILKGAQHDDLADVIVIAGIPEVVDNFFDGGLCEDCKWLLVDHRAHEAGIDVEIGHVLNLDTVVLI